MRKKFIFIVFEQYLFAYGDLHMGICIWGFAHILHIRNLHMRISICKNA